MNHEAIAISIRQITTAVRDTRLQLKVNPVSNRPDQDDRPMRELLAKADRWKVQLTNWQREVANRGHRNDMILGANRFGPGSYGARQSHASKAANLSQLDGALLTVLGELRQLVDEIRAGVGPERAALDAMSHAAESLIAKYNGKLTLEDAVVQREGEVVMKSVKALVPPGDIAMPVGQGIDLFTLVLGYIVLLRALRRG